MSMTMQRHAEPGVEGICDPLPVIRKPLQDRMATLSEALSSLEQCHLAMSVKR